MRISVLALDDVFDLGLAAVLDTLQTANELLQVHALAVPPFQVALVGVRRTIKTSRGMRTILQEIGAAPADCMVVPALGFKMPDALEQALGRADVRDATEALRESAHSGTTTAAACVGTFVLAESGLLNQQRATTTWWLAPLFRERYPAVALEDSSMIVKSGRFVTAGAALGHVDLALWIVRNVSPRLAALTAKYLIADSRPSQSVYALADHLMHSDPVVQRFEDWARTRLRHGFSLEETARAVGASKRKLARRLQGVLGKSPLSYFQTLRVQRAVHLLKTSNASIDEIATRVGYVDGASLRALLRRQLNMGVREIRRGGRNAL